MKGKGEEKRPHWCGGCPSSALPVTALLLLAIGLTKGWASILPEVADIVSMGHDTVQPVLSLLLLLGELVGPLHGVFPPVARPGHGSTKTESRYHDGRTDQGSNRSSHGTTSYVSKGQDAGSVTRCTVLGLLRVDAEPAPSCARSPHVGSLQGVQ
jgi:hypothetical protein